ncbi:three-Cys-motif partner protein TcmP [Pedobacter frigidisoli]|uniref:Three-Cys-motif partner protein TcmP n=1 Tax=Pedobacter frigidisoli TaxID=2530455 RepID=A0A4R0NW11_9SPHI|nr:three-Cys-motif partner protein TcmP [Pedobacter frigidisoli]TCD05872.1 three-Cys-motif partner protein TcmP [Pedobacter frigidisoli]
MENTFFKEQTSSSLIKAKIVAEYFPKYCRIILSKPQKEVRYLDLFAGPGKYEDGNHSTPLLLAKACAEDSVLSQKVHLLFNDNIYSGELEKNFSECFAENSFKFKPVFGNKTVGEDQKILNYLTKTPPRVNPYPTVLFFDPFGYKSIDTTVLSKFLANWGNELFLFVNIKRINQAMEVGKFDEMMKSLFPTTITTLRNDRKYKASVNERLVLIMDNLAQEFENAVSGKLYSCSFKFKEEDSVATSHFIIHFTKHQKGYELVKQIYHDYDNIGASLDKDGNYTYDAKQMGTNQLDFGDSNISSLSKSLTEKYKGRKITAKAVFDEHHPTTKWCGSHYLKTFRHMVDAGRLNAKFTDNALHKVTVLINENCELEFN